MAGPAKRQRLAEDGDDAAAPVSEYDQDQQPPLKKPKNETNAAARRTLFVRSLPAIATSDALTEKFSQDYPLKHATVVMDTETKQSKGYGFVTFADAEDAQRALEQFNGQAFLGRNMRIEIAQPRSRVMVTGGGPDGKPKSTVSAEAAAVKEARKQKMAEDWKPSKLIIRNLPWSIKEPEQLSQLFQKFGKVKQAKLPKVKETQGGFGFVVMRRRKHAEKALETINGTTVDGRVVAVDWAVEKDTWEKQQKVADEDAEDLDDEDGGAKVSGDEVDAKSENENDDVANFMRNFGDQLESEDDDDDVDDQARSEEEEDDDDEDWDTDEELKDHKPQKVFIKDNSTTLFVRNLPFTTLDASLKEHFTQFGPVRYARVVMDRATDRPKGTGFVCFFKVEDADACFRGAPRYQLSGANAIKKGDGVAAKVKHSVLEPETADSSGAYTLEGRVLQISPAVDRDSAVKLTEEGTHFRDDRDKDKRKLYLLSEGTVAAGTPLYEMLSPAEVKMREDSAKQRKKLIQNNPTLHLSLTRLSIRNLPRNIDSKALKALAREAVVGFAKDVKGGLRAQLSKEEEARGGEEMRDAERQRKTKGKGVARQAKVVFEGKEGAKIPETAGAGRSRGYGFVEYSSHRWALMGLRWLNGHALENDAGRKQRLIVEFAIENAQVVSRRKEREEKARTRSKEVVEAREKGEAPPKEKKPLRRDTTMAMTRKGMKGKKGRPVPGKSFDKVVHKVAKQADTGVRNKKPRSEPSSTNAKDSEDSRIAKRAHIIQKKRMMRRQRKP
ncbi:RNA-binding-containing protein [Venustampulla echinocandica]|uniref:RNA-binding-containing protein n=1 Tax=Venustampulla echinocandica TaxID=2656787 RepID=A0A370TCS2_9HELO|nr:RNA-binding-containing protein [Venustampulla echinocandica]RDL32052.1 RNA-binding-containing protein [Venustampulla echinocandica]